MENITNATLVKDMIDLFGGLRFRNMNLFNVNGMRLLLNACAETLEAIMVYPTDPRGKCISHEDAQSLADDFAALSSLQDFDLSLNKSLWTLQVAAVDIDEALETGPPNPVSNFLEHTLSTIKSIEFSGVMVIHGEDDFRGEQSTQHHRRFELFREVHEVQDFSLILCASVWEPVVDHSVRMLEEAIAIEKEKGGFDRSFPQPSVTDNPQETRADRRI